MKYLSIPLILPARIFDGDRKNAAFSGFGVYSELPVDFAEHGQDEDAPTALLTDTFADIYITLCLLLAQPPSGIFYGYLQRPIRSMGVYSYGAVLGVLTGIVYQVPDDGLLHLLQKGMSFR